MLIYRRGFYQHWNRRGRFHTQLLLLQKGKLCNKFRQIYTHLIFFFSFTDSFRKFYISELLNRKINGNKKPMIESTVVSLFSSEDNRKTVI